MKLFVEIITQAGCLLKTTAQGCPVRSGKVRDILDLGDKLAIITTDRLSAFDVVLNQGVPGRGWVLDNLTRFWMEFFAGIVKNHLLPNDETPAGLRLPELFGRVTVAKKHKVIPIECIARGYITGSGWKDYGKTGKICGIELPAGLRQCEKLAEPIFTPTTKAEKGHDEPVNLEDMVTILVKWIVDNDVIPAGDDPVTWAKALAREMQMITLLLYRKAAEYALTCGIIIADTKFEFGLDEDGNLVLIDEVLTPDSSRFWPADKYEVGHDQESFDKQYVRNYLETLVKAGTWDKTYNNIPVLPQEIIRNTALKYFEACSRITGKSVPELLRNALPHE